MLEVFWVVAPTFRRTLCLHFQGEVKKTSNYITHKMIFRNNYVLCKKGIKFEGRCHSLEWISIKFGNGRLH
jgi:hypothetical protein